MEIHYNINSTMDVLAKSYFLPSLPACLEPVPHRSVIPTSGNFAQDGFYDLIREKIESILSTLSEKLDDQLMLWTDVDIAFNRQCEPESIAEEITGLAQGKDLLLQKEHSYGETCNTGVMVIRRNARSLIFFAQVRIMLDLHDRSEQASANKLLEMTDNLRWGHLPPSYSSESNKGFSERSRLYHANSTISDSVNRKDRQLSRAIERWENQVAGDRATA